MARKKKTLPNPIDITIENLNHEGRGVAHHQDKTIFIDGALPGEKVSIEFTRSHNKYDEAKATKIHTSSEDRTTPRCEVFGICGGCSLQHMNHQKQLTHKQTVVLEQLKHIGHVTPKNILPPITGPQFGYRRKARLGVRYVPKKESLLIGFREKNGRFLTEMKACHVLHPDVGLKLENLQQLIQSLSIFEHIPQIEVAADDNNIALIIRHLKDFNAEDIEKIITFAKTHHYIIFLQPGKPKTIHKIWPNDDNPYLSYKIKTENIELLFHPTDFTQVNNEINQQMVSAALQHLNPQQEDCILDLFCGLGNFSLAIAKHCQQVIAVEGDQQMVERGAMNAKHNHIENIEFHAANLMEDCTNMPWLNHPFNKLLLDPPRSGAREFLPQLLTFKHLKKIVYISCNPATLARDCGYLVNELNYELDSVMILDMFPHTSHVETMACFNKPLP